MTELTAYRKVGPQSYRERFGLDFEDFSPGQRFRHRPGITFSQQENVNEALDTFNGAMLHYDDHYAAQTPWRKPLMVSTLTLQRAIGMASKTFGRRKSISRFDEIVMTGPVFGGDTLYAESEIMQTEDGDAVSGSVSVKTCMVKPDGAEVARLKYSVSVYRRGCGPQQDDGEPVSESRFAAYHEDGDGFLVEQAGLFFEEFAVGETFIHYPRRSMSWAEAVRHSRRALELSPQAYDPMWIDQNEGGAQRIPEAFLIGAATALTTRTFGRVVANLGWYNVVLSQAVINGDTVEAVSEIVDARPSRSREAEGILTVNTSLLNQRHELVLSFQRKLLVCRRSGQSLYAGAGY